MVFVVINGVVPDIAVVYSLQHLEFTQYLAYVLAISDRSVVNFKYNGIPIFEPPRETKIDTKNRIGGTITAFR